VGLAEVAGAALTSSQPSDRTDVPDAAAPAATSPAAATPAAVGPPLAAAPVETPGPSVTPPQSPESDVERAERAETAVADPGEVPDDDVLIAREESAAAAEAARIGGPAPPDTSDPAMEPVYEAGGGEQDGWEAAEEDLAENASHGDGGGNPIRDALTPELESDRSGASYGEPDDEGGPDDH
jgi:hypothetical protein